MFPLSGLHILDKLSLPFHAHHVWRQTRQEVARGIRKAMAERQATEIRPLPAVLCVRFLRLRGLLPDFLVAHICDSRIVHMEFARNDIFHALYARCLGLG